MADRDCPYLEKCPIFAQFKRYAQKVYMDMYCQGDFQRCRRHQLRTAGQDVPPDLMPYGGLAWEKLQRQ